MSLPIVVIHKQKSNYHSYCLLQARRSNPDSRLILIDDDQNERNANVDRYMLADYQSDANQLASVYSQLTYRKREPVAGILPPPLA
jgi:hypothetical protein